MNYTDKIFEMLGIKPKERFHIEGEEVPYYIDDKLQIYNDVNFPSMIYDISNILNGNIVIKKIVKPTKEEQLAIEYGKACGYNWLAKDANDVCYFYIEKPSKGSISWDPDTYAYLGCGIDISFLSWKDEEPYYIGE